MLSVHAAGDADFIALYVRWLLRSRVAESFEHTHSITAGGARGVWLLRCSMQAME